MEKNVSTEAEIKELIDNTEHRIRRLSEFGVFDQRLDGDYGVQHHRTALLQHLLDARQSLLRGDLAAAARLATEAEGKLHDRLYSGGLGFRMRLFSVNQLPLVAWYLLVFLLVINVATGFLASLPRLQWLVFADELWDVPIKALGLGALGATLRGSWWLYRQTAAEQHRANFLASHLLAPLIGALFGLFTYLLLGAGLLLLGEAGDASAIDEALLPAALAFLAGYSWEWILERIEAFTQNTRNGGGGGGERGGQPASQPREQREDQPGDGNPAGDGAADEVAAARIADPGREFLSASAATLQVHIDFHGAPADAFVLVALGAPGDPQPDEQRVEAAFPLAVFESPLGTRVLRIRWDGQEITDTVTLARGVQDYPPFSPWK